MAPTDERTTGRSRGWPCPPWAPSRRSRSTCWPTPPSSVISAPAPSPASRWRGRCSPPRSASSTSSPTAPPRASPASSAPATGRTRQRRGVDGCWLAVGLGLVLTLLGVALAPQIVDVMGASTTSRPWRSPTCASASSARPRSSSPWPGTGYLRGMQDTRTTLVIAVARQRRQPPGRAALRVRARPRHRGLGVGHGARAVRRRDRVRRDRRAGGAPRGRGGAATSRGGPRQRDGRQPPGRAHRVAHRRVAHRDRDRLTHQRRRGRRAPDLHADLPVPRAVARRARDRRAGDGRTVPRRVQHPRRAALSAAGSSSSASSSAWCSGSRSWCLGPGSPTCSRTTRVYAISCSRSSGSSPCCSRSRRSCSCSTACSSAPATPATWRWRCWWRRSACTSRPRSSSPSSTAACSGCGARSSLWMLARFVGMAGRFRTTRWQVEGAIPPS